MPPLDAPITYNTRSLEITLRQLLGKGKCALTIANKSTGQSGFLFSKNIADYESRFIEIMRQNSENFTIVDRDNLETGLFNRPSHRYIIEANDAASASFSQEEFLQNVIDAFTKTRTEMKTTNMSQKTQIGL